MRSLNPLACAVAILSLITTSALAQHTVAKNNKTTLSASEAIHLAPQVNGASSSVMIQPNTKVSNKFTSMFPEANQPEWRQFNNHYHISFFNGDRKAVAVMTAKGFINYSLVDCTLGQLPQGLQKKIGRDYAGYTFVSAMQINAHHTVAYQAILENADLYVTLKATEDGVEEIQSIRKTE